jgi:hypothetical protein
MRKARICAGLNMFSTSAPPTCATRPAPASGATAEPSGSSGTTPASGTMKRLGEPLRPAISMAASMACTSPELSEPTAARRGS